ncbi:sulfotransferase family protein [Gloeothece verrucosa]|uniref:Sulfotransferase n=1 Tax=Gloeothece verrucosa (strain PCC 7822) TaxID=497965 RepID=E0UNA7_GLOV7|nr:sulfotransferase family protein [Gloeothece verrucosa]ADN18437.1 hypothetical protein Cyan7822_6768 [Gloeothece verrucosa PCC 7822]
MKPVISTSKKLINRTLKYCQQGSFIASRLWRYGELVPQTRYVFTDRKLIYLVVQKVACTSIKTTIARSYGIKVQQEEDIHLDQFLQSKLGRPKKNEYPEYTIFSFVRNPYDRLVSCYRDKVLDVKQRYSVPYFDTKLGYYPYYIPHDISFAEFVQIIVKIPDYLADNHFKSQYAILSSYGKLLPDFIGRMETLQQDWEKLAKTYNFDVNLAHLNSTQKTSFSKYYTQELVDLVYQRYQKDFEHLGYSQAKQALRQKIENNLQKK